MLSNCSTCLSLSDIEITGMSHRIWQVFLSLAFSLKQCHLDECNIIAISHLWFLSCIGTTYLCTEVIHKANNTLQNVFQLAKTEPPRGRIWPFTLTWHIINVYGIILFLGLYVPVRIYIGQLSLQISTSKISQRGKMISERIVYLFEDKMKTNLRQFYQPTILVFTMILTCSN